MITLPPFRRAAIGLSLTAFLLLLLGCNTVDEPGPNTTFGPSAPGFFIVNEGRFGGGNGEVSFFNTQLGREANDLFAQQNQRPLGDVAQSMSRLPDGGYAIVVNNSNKLERTDAELRSRATVTALQSPRYAVANGSSLYVSEWGTGNFAPPSQVAVINLSNNTVSTRVSLPVLAEQLLAVGNTLLVANAGFVSRDTLGRLDLSTNSALPPITLTGTPVSLAQDATGRVWVACRKSGAHVIVRLDAAFAVAQTQPLTGAPSDLVALGNVLYWRQGNAIWRWAVDGGSPAQISVRPNLYGLGVDGPRGRVIALRAPSFTAPGFALRLDATTGAAIDSFTVGVGPNGVLVR